MVDILYLFCSLKVDKSPRAADSAEDQKRHAGPGCEGIQRHAQVRTAQITQN